MRKYVILLVALGLFGLSAMADAPGFGFEEYKAMMKGFLNAIGVDDRYMTHLLSCLTDQKSVENRFVENLNKIDRGNFKNLPLLAHNLADLYEGIIMSIVEIDLCAEENSESAVVGSSGVAGTPTSAKPAAKPRMARSPPASAVSHVSPAVEPSLT